MCASKFSSVKKTWLFFYILLTVFQGVPERHSNVLGYVSAYQNKEKFNWIRVCKRVVFLLAAILFLLNDFHFYWDLA